MTEEEWTELIDLYVMETLPDALRARVETFLATNPEAAQDARTLRATQAHLQSAPAERPDAWFTERLLDSLLREHAASTQTIHTQGDYPSWQRPPLRKG
jgi:anti-sigma factor RsiW